MQAGLPRVKQPWSRWAPRFLKLCCEWRQANERERRHSDTTNLYLGELGRFCNGEGLTNLQKEQSRRRQIIWPLAALVCVWLPLPCAEPLAELFNPYAPYHSAAIEFMGGWSFWVTLPVSVIALWFLIVELVTLLLRGFSEEARY